MHAEEKMLAHELGGEDESPFNKTLCERCEKAKPKIVCYECGGFGTALCDQCSQIIHQCGSFTKHKVILTHLDILILNLNRSSPLTRRTPIRLSKIFSRMI